MTASGAAIEPAELPSLDDACGQRWRYRDLIETGETWYRLKPKNVPSSPETYAAIRTLCAELLDPVADAFGIPVLTYGFASPALTKHIPARIYPRLDQHAGCEHGQNGRPICRRFGQAVDFFVPDVSSGVVAAWIEEKVRFDRLYFYGPDRSLHVSIGPECRGAVVTMFAGPSGRLMPQQKKPGWLRASFPV